ncbi:hypothetical protein KILIM_064_00090 [Kineosphaera limosa NBRC 100340]|uniref:AI-2E family transporter n=1 Tax=Kineosphaera limosa NBRC 100340 TaxID=1184609 RepID=K6WU25_9MICO|nr:hypothetical protein KILIM_064_00090 [Kineosphaera limosa NBRC 100340]
MPYSLRVAAGIGWRLIIVAVVGLGLLRILGMTKTVMIPVAVGVLLTALAMPAMVFLNHRLGLGRHLSAAITTLGSLGLVVGALTLAGNQLVTGFTDLSDQIAAGIQQIQEWLAEGPFAIGSDQINQAITAGQNWVQENASGLTSGALSAGSTATEVLVGAIIALICMFFFLAEGDSIWSFFVRMMPRHVQAPVHEAFRRGYVSLSSYVKTQVLVAFVDAFFISLGAWLLGLPLVIPLFLIIFFASAVPIVGAVVSGALAVVLALVVQGPLIALAMLAVVIGVQQLESHLLQPVLMGRAVSLHPLAVLLGVAAFSFLFGIVGALFAVPFLAVTNTVILYWTGHDKFPMLAHGYSAVSDSPKSLVAHDPDDPEPGSKGARRQRRRIGDISPITLREKAVVEDRKGRALAAERAEEEGERSADDPEQGADEASTNSGSHPLR